MSQDIEGYGPRADQTDVDRLLEDARTFSPSAGRHAAG